MHIADSELSAKSSFASRNQPSLPLFPELGNARLNELASLLVTRDPQCMLHMVLNTLLDLYQAERGHFSICHPNTGNLEINASLGCDQAYLNTFSCLNNKSACGKAFDEKRRVIIHDIETEETISDTLKDIARKYGFRALFSTPVITRTGKCIGTLAIYFPTPRTPNEFELKFTDGCVQQAADFLERAKTEEILRQHEKRLRLATTKAGIGVWEADLVNNIGRYFGATIELVNHGRGQLLTEECLLKCHPDDRERALKAWNDALEQNIPYDVEVRLNQPAEDGGELWVITRGWIERDDTGKPVYGSGIVFDITAYKRAQEALKAEITHKDELLAAIK